MKAMSTGFFLALAAFPFPVAAAAEPVRIVVGPDAPALERLAAEEIAENVQQLFDRKGEVVTSTGEGDVILVGSPATNPAVKEAVKEWPKLSDQGHTLKSVKAKGRPALVVGGGAPAATFWAASELAHRWGVRSVLMGNLLPVDKPAFSLDGFDVVLEPVLKHRAWTLMDSTPVGAAAWGLADQKKMLRQLARLKFNRIVLDLQPWQPFVAWEYEGIAKTSALLWPDGPIKVDGDTAGRAAFRGQAVFDNPDLAGKTTPAERTKAGIALLTGIIDEAHRLGMTVAVAVSPFEFPKEFESLLPDAEPTLEHGDLAVMPGAKAPLIDAAVQKLATAQLKALVAAYPTIDALILNTTVDPNGDPQRAWALLQLSGTIAKTAKLADLLSEAKKRKGILSGDDAAALVGAQMSALPALRRLGENPDATGRKGPPLSIELSGIDPILARLGLRITPAGAGLLFVPDEPPKPIAGGEPLNLVGSLDWSDLHVGVLPRFHTRTTASALKTIRESKWAGFRIHAPLSSGLDPTALFVSRASFDADVTPESSLRDLLDHAAGEGVADRVLKAFSLVEDAADAVDPADLHPAAADGEVFLRHAAAEAVPAWWAKVRDAQTQAMDEMYRANTRAREGGREFTLFYARRFEFGMEVMNALEALRQASIAESDKAKEKQVEQLEKAIESTYGGLNALAAVPCNPSDRGVIALLNKHGYRELQTLLEAAEK